MFAKFHSFWKMLGPGLLYAGAAVGVSHLVMSTRAGAAYGYGLIWILLLANFLKYPFFEFGPRYAATTGNNLITGYMKVGKWAVILFLILTISTMFAIQAAVTIVTAGLVGNIFGIHLDPYRISLIILSVSIIILLAGKYSFLDKTIKYVVLILAVSTIVTALTAFFGNHEGGDIVTPSFSWYDATDILFIIAFAGWMPAPIDVTVWQSLWTVAKRETSDKIPDLKNVLLDFRIGYIGTAFLAICFMVMGKEVLYGTGEELSPSGLIFSSQLINIYTDTIGKWSYWFIAAAALTTMFSTTITCLDAYPRVIKPITYILIPAVKNRKSKIDIHGIFWSVVVAGGAILLMGYLSSTMQSMVDIATSLSFVTAPLLAVLNYIVITDSHVPVEGRPGLWLKIYSWVGILALSAFTLFFLYWRYLK